MVAIADRYHNPRRGKKGKTMNKYFTQKFMESCSTLSVIREIKTKTTRRYHAVAVQELGQHQMLARLQSAGNTHTLPPEINWWKTIQGGINLRADDVPANPMAHDSCRYTPLGDKFILMGQGRGWCWQQSKYLPTRIRKTNWCYSHTL